MENIENARLDEFINILTYLLGEIGEDDYSISNEQNDECTVVHLESNMFEALPKFYEIFKNYENGRRVQNR